MQSKLIALVIPLLFLFLFGLGLQPIYEAKAAPPQDEAIDPALKSCRDFAVARSHLAAAYHTVTDGYENVPGQKQPVPHIKGVENPEKMQEFMTWYANGGHEEMFILGSSCVLDILMKSGTTQANQAQLLITLEQLQNAEFFAEKLLKQCTGKSMR